MEMIIASPTPKKTHNVSWSPAMTEFLLEYLTEQTKLGKKGPTGFKVAILIQASEAINEKFEKNLVFCNLQYHLKSLKKKWIIIQDLKKLDGVSFNPETRELRMIPEMYQKYVEANPSHTQFINKPIANYEKMEIVFGNNESGANEKLNDDNNTDPKNENEDFEDSQIATPGEESRKRKKPEPNEEGESAKSESNKKAGHIKWSPIMTEFLLNYLAEEVKMGHKGLSSFKGNALSNAAQAVNHKFGKKMTTYHVQNHLKTLKRRWKTIQKLKVMNGVSFNQENNSLEMDFEEYKVYVEKNPLEEQFINKPIKMYAEMEIVCGYENTEENNNNNININNKKSIEGASEVSSPDVNIDAADLGLNVDEMEEIPLLPPANNNNNVEEGKIKKDPDELDTPSINMEIEKTSDTSSSKHPRNISWSPELSEFVLKFLAEQTRMGNKGSNGFKISVINSAAAAINEKFGKKMNFSNVQNHLKTLKRRWRAIQSVKNMNGVVFHQESKVLEMGHEMYQKHLQENPGHEQFINTPIELYDEMEIVCSNSNYDNKAVTCTPIDLCIIETPENEDKEQIDEQTMPLMAIHYNENNLLEPNNAPNKNTNDTICIINTDNSNNLSLSTEVINDDNNNNNVDNNVETNMDTNNDINNNDVGANNENNNVIVNNIGENNDNNSNNDNRLGEAKMENISSIIGQMAEALKELSTEKLINFAREIMNELRTIEGEFESKTIRLVQRYLVEHTLDAACFLTYNKDEKVAWVKDFLKDHLDGNES